jgi:hypothetical protein
VGGIAGQGKVQLVLVAKLLQLFHGIATYPQNLCPELVQFFFGVTELVRLARSTGGVGFGEKEKNNSLALESLQRDFLRGVAGQRKVWGLVTNIKHDALLDGAQLSVISSQQKPWLTTNNVCFIPTPSSTALGLFADWLARAWPS